VYIAPVQAKADLARPVVGFVGGAFPVPRTSPPRQGSCSTWTSAGLRASGWADEFVISADEKTSVPFAWCFTRAELERLLGCLAGEERLLAVA
jgi:hypothetical protein